MTFLLFYIYLFILEKNEQKMAQQENNREFLITHTQWDQAQVNLSLRHCYVMVT